MVDVFIREVCCGQCGQPTAHLDSILQKIIPYQAASPDDGLVNHACPICKKLARSPLLFGAKFVTGVDLLKYPYEAAEYIVAFECASKDCSAPVVFLALVTRDIQQDHLQDFLSTNWQNVDAICANGFPPSGLPTFQWERVR
jgi:hypothetical protein